MLKTSERSLPLSAPGVGVQGLLQHGRQIHFDLLEAALVEHQAVPSLQNAGGSGKGPPCTWAAAGARLRISTMRIP